jgi:hypothetical protein
MNRVADVDMGLWSAAHLSSEASGLADEMYADKYFMEVRLRNLLAGVGRRWKRTVTERLTWARLLLKHDHILAGIIAARCLEDTVRMLADQIEVAPGTGKPGQTEFSALVDAVSRRRELTGLGVSPGLLPRLRELRNDAVHSHSPIAKADAKELVEGACQLQNILE